MPAEVLDRPTVLNSDVQKKPSPRYRVLLHNDNFNLPVNVVRWLMEVVQLSEQSAINVMMTAHTTGIGLVKVCDQEMAEFYVEQLQARGLTMSMEPEE